MLSTSRWSSLKAFSHHTGEPNSMPTHWLHSHLNSVSGNANWMHIEPIYLWRWIGTESELNSLPIHRIDNKITYSYAPTNGNVVKAFGFRPTYTLYSPSKIWTTMAYHAGMLLTRSCRNKRQLTKQSRVVSCSTWFHVLHNSRSTSSTTSNKVWYVIEQALVYVSIHLQRDHTGVTISNVTDLVRRRPNCVHRKHALRGTSKGRFIVGVNVGAA